MAITITVDKESEFVWIRTVIESGVLNSSSTFKQIKEIYDIPLNQNVTYKPSDNYVEDLKSLKIKEEN